MSETSTTYETDAAPTRSRGSLIALAAVAGLLLIGGLAFLLGRDRPPAIAVDIQIVEPQLGDLATLDDVSCPTTAIASNPLPNSYATVEGGRIDGTQFASGQIVVWNVITSTTEGQSDPAEFALSFSEAVDQNAGVICTFVSDDDPINVAGENDENPTAVFTPGSQDPDKVNGQLVIDGLSTGQTSVVQLWTLIAPESGQQPNLRLRLKPELGTDAPEASASVRASFKQPVEPTPGTLELTIDDGNTSLATSGTITTSWTVENTTTDRVFDFVDLVGSFEGGAKMTTVDVTEESDGFRTTCDLADGTDNGFACELGFVKPGERVVVTASGSIGRLAESFYTGAAGSCDDGFQDVCSTGTLGFLGQFSRNELELSEAADIAGDGSLSVVVISDPETGYVNRPLTLSVVLTSAVDGVVVDEIELTGCPDDELELANGDLNLNSLLDRSEVWEFGCLARLVREDGEVIIKGRTTDGEPAQIKAPFTVELISPGIRLIRDTVDDSARFTVQNLGDVTLTDLAVISKTCEPRYTEGDLDGDGDLDPAEEWLFWCQVDSGEGRVFAVDTQGGVVTSTEVLGEDL